ncbi:MAG: hypothetical protein KKD69_05145 [Euryarchaeota archaeon]|nr:hypothetical protein [Euryarchaeota archaeon]MBU4491831.1 hypothetical protein [Euryarchaeota archaeon]
MPPVGIMIGGLVELRDTIDSLIETLELQTNKQFLKAIKDAEREFEEGKTISFDELVEERELKNEF